jgi:hypothetical protein
LITIGTFKSKTGKSYDCHFIRGEKLAEAAGPLPERVGAGGLFFETLAEFKQEARQKIFAAIESGILK